MAVGNQGVGGFQQPMTDVGSLGDIAQPLANPTGAPQVNTPAQSPQEMQQRVAGWSNFFGILAQPGMSEALLKAGATMMQPIPMGGSAMGQFGKGIAVGTESLSQSQDKADQLALEKQRTNDISARTDLARRQVSLQETQYAAGLPEADIRLQGLKEQLKAAQRNNDPESVKRINAQIDAAVGESQSKATLNRAEAKYYDQGGANTAAASVQELMARANARETQFIAKNRRMPTAAEKADMLIGAQDELNMSKQEPSYDSLFRDMMTANYFLPKEKQLSPEEIQSNIMNIIDSYRKRRSQAPGAAESGAAPTTPAATPAKPPGPVSGLQASASAPAAKPKAAGLPAARPQDVEAYRNILSTLKTPSDIQAMKDAWNARFSDNPPE